MSTDVRSTTPTVPESNRSSELAFDTNNTESSGDTATPVGKNSSSGLGRTSDASAVQPAANKPHRSQALRMGTDFDRLGPKTVACGSTEIVKDITAFPPSGQPAPRPPVQSARGTASTTH